MLDVSVIAWVWMLSAMLVSSGAGLALSRLVTWTDPARQAGIPRAFGLAIAPFLLGLMAVVALGVFRGASHAFHLGVVFAGLLALCATACFTRPVGRPVSRETSQPMGVWEWIFGVILAVWVLALLVNAALLPLLQNDSLEYAIVGRLLFESRDLLSYPAIHPEQSSSGFYGPWTHPPLYVALIYLMYVFQGHAEMPGLMRTIAPWCALAATGLVFALGNLTNRLTGILSSLFFLTVPLFFLGAGSSLLDALPVLGITIVMAGIIGVQGPPLRRSLMRGLVLGAALWAHSVAVIFLPMAVLAIALNDGWRNIRGFMVQAATVVGAATLVAAWPYCRNLTLFGSLISDNPAVFAMPELAWEEYFRLTRGIDSWPEKIQYGILKGWFALEAYSLLFWLMLLGAAIYMRRLVSEVNAPRIRAGDLSSVPDPWNLTALAVLICFMGGVILSTLMGIDLMIRNERYWLITIPFAAVLAGGFISDRPGGIKNLDGAGVVAKPVYRFKVVAPLFALLFLLQAIITIAVYCWIPYLRISPALVVETQSQSPLQKFLSDRGVSDVLLGSVDGRIILEENAAQVGEKTVPSGISALGKSIHDKLFLWPAMNAVLFLRESVPISSTVLSLRPADMFYSGRKMVSYLDPRLLPVYREENALQAWQMLRELGIDYLHLPDYYIPTMYNSVLMELCARPDLAEMVFSADGTQIYKLLQREVRLSEKAFDLTPGKMPWTTVSKMTGGRKALVGLHSREATIEMGGATDKRAGLWLFRRDWSTEHISGIGFLDKPLALKTHVPVRGDDEYRLEIDLEGHSYARVSLAILDEKGNCLQDKYFFSGCQVRIGEIVLGPAHPENRFVRRFVTPPAAAYIRVGVEHIGGSELHIRQARLIALAGNHR